MGGGEVVWTPHLKNKKKSIGLISNTGPETIKHKATKPTFSLGPSLNRQRIAIYLDDVSCCVSC